jgi:hypothetical protein
MTNTRWHEAILLRIVRCVALSTSLSSFTFSSLCVTFQICHKTGNKKCPWKDLIINADALQDHIDHGDKAVPCASTCTGCDVFDTDTCRCEFVSCSPTNSPSSSPTASPTSSPTASPSSSPTTSPTSPTTSPTSSPTAVCQDKASRCNGPVYRCDSGGLVCYCSYTTEGTPLYFKSIGCNAIGRCSSTADCPAGTYCIPNTCCNGGIGGQCFQECSNPGFDAFAEKVETAQISFTDLDTCETLFGHCPKQL